ncbi:MFS transporter [Cohnella cholangitidis]|uniref:MFS transporter n=1 Tax=Cohnella cholangitidis TaxID=2598458 RepID=A0A7G5BW38_9BACL|nr:MFS transporter [Cohnella cholangitidis]QMV41172.1 MFS transporter [Cohnella cholangitidis]
MSIVTRLKGFNFFYFAMFALFLSFLPIYSAEVGVSGTHIGLILGMGSLISIVAQPLWGMVSDKSRTIKKVLLLLLLASILIGTLLFHAHQIWSLIVLVALMNVFFLPTDPLVESLNFQTSQREKVNYGSVRMFGALGYACVSLTAGYALKLWGMDSLSWIFFGVGCAALLLALSLSDVQASAARPSFHHLKDFFLQSHTWIFFVIVLIVAIPHKMNDTFIGLYMEELGGDVRLTGMSWFVMTITETVMFAFVSRMIKPGKEAIWMTLAAGLYALRFLLSSMIGTPYGLVALQVFQGFTFVLFYVGALQYLYRIVPEQWKSTGQTALTATFFGVSGIIGSTVGGLLLDLYGGAVLYRGMGLFALFGLALGIYLVRKPATGTQDH